MNGACGIAAASHIFATAATVACREENGWVVRVREGTSDGGKSIQLWFASLPKTVGAVRRGVFDPLNYSGTLHQTPTPIFPLHPPNKLKPRRLPTRDKTCHQVWQPDHHRLSCLPLEPLISLKICPFREPIGQMSKIQLGQPSRHPPYTPEPGGAVLGYSQTSHARCGYEYHQMRQPGLDRYQPLASDLYGGEGGPTT